MSDVDHEPIGKGLILETFVHVVEKAAAKERVMEKLNSREGRVLQSYNLVGVLMSVVRSRTVGVLRCQRA